MKKTLTPEEKKRFQDLFIGALEEINEMNKIYLGKDESGENITLDFEEEEINFILLAGKTGSGKGIFDCNLYKQLSENNTSEDIGFILWI